MDKNRGANAVERIRSLLIVSFSTLGILLGPLGKSKDIN